MAPPSRLSIATSSLQRLVKEESSYHKELEQQEARIKKFEQGSEDENAEFLLKQERRALEETKAVFPSLKQRISDALAKLEQELESNKALENTEKVEEINKAKEAVAKARTAVREIS